MAHLIGLAGPIGAGKSTLADYLIQAHGYTRVDFASAIKEEIIQFCRKTLIAHLLELGHPDVRPPSDPRWDELIEHVMYRERTPLTRALQQEWGMMRREQDPDYWISAWKARMIATGSARVVNDNMRFAREARAIKALGGILIKIERPGLQTSELAKDDPTEHGLATWKEWDYVIQNIGSIKYLQTCAEEILGS